MGRLPAIAKVLDVSVEEFLGQPKSKSRPGGPVGKVRQTFEEVSKLPRRQQQHILRVIGALIAQAKAES